MWHQLLAIFLMQHVHLMFTNRGYCVFKQLIKRSGATNPALVSQQRVTHNIDVTTNLEGFLKVKVCLPIFYF